HDSALHRGKRIQFGLMAVAWIGLFGILIVPLEDAETNGLASVLTIIFFSTIVITGLGLLWTRWLPFQSRKARKWMSVISVPLAVAGVIPMFIFDMSGPIIAPPPFLISYVTGGILLSLLTTPKVYKGHEAGE